MGHRDGVTQCDTLWEAAMLLPLLWLLGFWPPCSQLITAPCSFQMWPDLCSSHILNPGETSRKIYNSGTQTDGSQPTSLCKGVLKKCFVITYFQSSKIQGALWRLCRAICIPWTVQKPIESTPLHPLKLCDPGDYVTAFAPIDSCWEIYSQEVWELP